MSADSRSVKTVLVSTLCPCARAVQVDPQFLFQIVFIHSSHSHPSHVDLEVGYFPRLQLDVI